MYKNYLYINSISPTHRFFENKFCILGRIQFGLVHLWPASKGESFVGLGILPFHSKNYIKTASLRMKPPMAIKLTGGSHYVTSLLWVSLFGSSQPRREISRPNKTSNTNSSHKISANLTKLSRLSCSPKQCVTRWFLSSDHDYQGFQVSFFANHHETCTELVYGIPVYMHCLKISNDVRNNHLFLNSIQV